MSLGSTMKVIFILIVQKNDRVEESDVTFTNNAKRHILANTGTLENVFCPQYRYSAKITDCDCAAVTDSPFSRGYQF